jgi:hypothetical protein
MTGFPNIVGHCGIAINAKKRAQMIEEIIRCFCLARKHQTSIPIHRYRLIRLPNLLYRSGLGLGWHALLFYKNSL